MLGKLTIRNAKRSLRDYLLYMVTMALIAALMFAFNGMVFSEDMQALYGEMTVFIVLVSMASFFIVIIVIWLVHYMVNFMLEKRSREFGTYLLLGMRVKEIARIFRREHLLLGGLSLLLGFLPGMLFQVMFVNVFYSIMDTDYIISVDFSIWNLVMTGAAFTLAYVLALLRIKKKLKRMSIHHFMYADKENEKTGNEKKTWKKIFVFLSAAYIILFNILALGGRMNVLTVWFYIAGLIAAIYLLYMGLSAFFVSYIKKKGNNIYRGANLFVFRQLSSKIKTMQFTMGTLSILFTAALLGWTVVMMFAAYQSTELRQDLPADILIFSDQPDYDFAGQLEMIRADVEVVDEHVYSIYENKTDDFNSYLYEAIDGTWTSEEEGHDSSTYFIYDTYIGLSDYNHLRKICGYEAVELLEGSYIIQCKERVSGYIEDAIELISVHAGEQELAYAGMYTDQMTQGGQNGADYLIVVPDSCLSSMTAFYTMLAVEISGEASFDLEQRLEETMSYYRESGYYEYAITPASGSNQILMTASDVNVRTTTIMEISFVSTAICFVLAYIGIVFLCVALTILSVQQLSDSAKYKFRYRIMKNIGMSRKETDLVVLKQLGIYFLCPFLISIVLSMFMGMFASERFVYFTGVGASAFQYYILAVIIFAVMYIIYFIVTYVGFLRNIYE